MDSKAKNEKGRNGEGDGEPKNNHIQGPPPPTPLNKTKLTAGTIQGPLIKKDKRHSSSRFNITKNRELEMLPPLKVPKGDIDIRKT
ncbi:serine/threonine-protein phosphatase 2A 56 kDa regulatory subunit delta isoform-like [Rhynchophorus ferrugineus]|uniref:serine/threonine-protein phosphatase 2A 56 kDa regulatory subunit delta isoform-like n=1 Tax=Rhynchophorus ferrugineus TaxID=354439 RepID=UPI003FCE4275